jgi:hypothetical protein
MNKFFKIVFAILFSVATVNARAQMLNPGDKLPQGALVYSLPSTTFCFIAEAEHESFTAGPYAKYAQKYLGIQVREESGESYRLISLQMFPYIEADYSANYALNLGNSKNASANFLELVNQGLIVWSDSYAGKSEKVKFPSVTSGSPFAETQATLNITNETTTLYKNVQTPRGLERIPVSQNQLVEKSPEKRAEEAASAIFKLRAKRMEIITGETDATFSGEAMKAAIDEINRLEKEYLTLFTGHSIFNTQRMSFELVPQASSQKQIYIAFRISDSQGLLPPTNIAGRPVVLELSYESPEAELPAMDLSYAKGRVVYRRPAAMVARVTDEQTLLLQARVPVYQLGKLISFPIEVAIGK